MGLVPEFIRPQRAIIVEGGGGGLELLGPVVVIAAVAVAAGVVLLWLVAHLVLIAVVVGIVGVGTLVVMQLFKRWMVVVHDVPSRAAPGQQAEISQGYPLPRHLAITQAPRAIAAPAQHVHFHFHGLPAEDAAAVIAQRGYTGRASIEKE